MQEQLQITIADWNIKQINKIISNQMESKEVDEIIIRETLNLYNKGAFDAFVLLTNIKSISLLCLFPGEF